VFRLMIAGQPADAVDAIIVPCSQAEDLAAEIARLWPVEGYGTALDLAAVEGLARADAARHEWDAPGREFLARTMKTRVRGGKVAYAYPPEHSTATGSVVSVSQGRLGTGSSHGCEQGENSGCVQ
jgi:hypothetical protein